MISSLLVHQPNLITTAIFLSICSRFLLLGGSATGSCSPATYLQRHRMGCGRSVPVVRLHEKSDVLPRASSTGVQYGAGKADGHFLMQPHSIAADADSESHSFSRISNSSQKCIMVLGAHDVGKTTLLHHLQLHLTPAHGSRENLMLHTLRIQSAILQLVSDITAEMKRLHIEFEEMATESCTYRLRAWAAEPHIGNFALALITEDLAKFSKDKGTHALLARVCETDLSDDAYRVLDIGPRAFSEDYIPTFDDLITVRLHTSGVNHFQANSDGTILNVIDMGGLRSDRKKWFSRLPSADIVFFVAALSDFERTLFEDPKINRLHESLLLFSELANQLKSQCRIVLFLTKLDVLHRRLSERADALDALNRVLQMADASPCTDAAHAAEAIRAAFAQRAKKIQQTYLVDLTSVGDTSVVLGEAMGEVWEEDASIGGSFKKFVFPRS